MEKNKAFTEFVTYYKPTRTKDTYGQVTEAFSEYQKAFMSVERYQGNEDQRGDQIMWSQFWVFTGHYIPEIDTTYRILYDGNYYAILDIEYHGNRRFQTIKADKIVE